MNTNTNTMSDIDDSCIDTDVGSETESSCSDRTNILDYMVLTDSDTELDEYIPPFFERVSDDYVSEMETQAKECIADYINDHIVRFSSPTFETTLIQDIATLLLEEWKLIELCDDEDYDDVVDFVEQIYTETRTLPLRQEETVDHTAICASTDVGRILDRIRNIPQAKQRTMEWYETRHNLLTASNLWKVFGTPAQYNSLIYEKCLPIETVRAEKRQMSIDSTNAMQIGVKYEPLSIMLYERQYGTRISEVGCIPHAQYPYIGASPDGINMTPGFPRYGRMIEVKNIVNREITGIPLEHYWIQMQLQMEACDLDECDFIETRFIEIDENCPRYDVVKSTTHDLPKQKGQMGCILYFLPRVSIGETTHIEPEYAYSPLDMEVYSSAEIEWEAQQRSARPNHVLFKQTYWTLDQFSCVLVRRNRGWFRSAQPKIADAWNTILQERITGYDHRISAKKKRLQTEVVCSENTTTHYIKNMPFSSNICLVKLDADESEYATTTTSSSTL